MKTYPFKFLDAYTKEDEKIFFGRDEEIEELYRLVFQTNYLLVYGASGTGKTSLIRCGLANRFNSSQWMDLMIRRDSDINKSLLDAIRRKLPQTQPASVIAEGQERDWFTTLMEANIDSEPSSPRSDLIQSDNPVIHALQELYQATFTPIYLVFDQFEELYTLGDPKKHPEEQQQFAHTLSELIQTSLPVWVIIVIREEYQHRLYDLERAIPQMFVKKLHIGPMDLQKVERVILNATTNNPESNIVLERGKEGEIAHTIVEKIREGDVTVKLPYLQLFMDRLYQKATGESTERTMDAEVSLALTNQMGSIDVVLADFMKQENEIIYQKLTTKFGNLPTDIVWRILSPFATMDGTKVPIKRENLHRKTFALDLPINMQVDELIKVAVAELENSRILNYRKEEETYEVAHDTLALQIADKRSLEEKTYLKARRTVSEGFASYQDTKTLLDQEQLNLIRPYEKRLKEELSANHQGFINKSKNRRLWIRGMWIGGVLTAFFVVIGFILYNEARKAENLLQQTKKEQEIRLLLDAGIAKDALEFYNLESRASLIVEVGGCPVQILIEMDALFAHHSDSTDWKKIIDKIKDEQKNNPCYK